MARGAGIGLVVLIGVATLRAVLDRNIEDFADSGWTLPLFVVLLAGYFLAGWVAQRHAADRASAMPRTPTAPSPGSARSSAGSRSARASGSSATSTVGSYGAPTGALRPGQLFGAFVIAAGIGMLGGALAARRTPAPSDVQP